MQETTEILEIFYQLLKIPHGSGETQEMFAFLHSFAKQYHYVVRTDKANNILAFLDSKTPQICFQGHYDMVCVGNAAQKILPKLLESTTKENGYIQTWLQAQDSSLGADNGMGLAIMLLMMKKGINAEFLFTNDEEIGMIGAKNLALGIQSKILVNLDSEVLGEITIGCAGGFDLFYQSKFDSIKSSESAESIKSKTDSHYYLLEAQNFVGGHSGIDINNPALNAKNAIMQSASYLWQIQQDSNNATISILDWQGGEKRNSIPIHSKILFASNKALDIPKHDFFSITQIPNAQYQMQETTGIDFAILYKLLSSLQIGVIDKDGENVINSLNLATLHFHNNTLDIAFMGRANTKMLLDSNIENLKSTLSQPLQTQIVESRQIQIGEYYAPWEKQNDIYNIVATMNQSMQEILTILHITPKIVELHAGLECGILLTKFQEMGIHDVRALSIGPTICSPHSTKEKVWIESIGFIYQILQNFMKKINE